MVEVVAVLIALAVGVTVGAIWTRRSAGSVSQDTAAVPEAAPAPDPIAAAEVSTGATTGQLDAEALSTDLVAKALADLRLGVVVYDGDGDELYRNHTAGEFKTARHGNALTEAALERVVEGALIGLSLQESLDLYGPPQRSLRVQASPILDGAKVSGVTAVVEDVTEARHIERVRSDFVANVSHELRTPVGAMSVLAETLADCEDPDVAGRLTDRIQREAVRLSQTISDLLILSRLDAGVVPNAETTDLGSVVAMAIDRVSEVAVQRGIDIVVVNELDQPILVDGEQGQLVSAVANLLDNAIKYTDGVGSPDDSEGGDAPASSVGSEHSDQSKSDVTVTLDIEGGSSSTDPPEAVIAVEDSGIGVPEADLNRIFERFYRVDNARSRDTGGTGLGLSIVRNTVINHGGTVEVDSVEGRGSIFTVRLPLSSTQLQLDKMAESVQTRVGNE